MAILRSSRFRPEDFGDRDEPWGFVGPSAEEVARAEAARAAAAAWWAPVRGQVLWTETGTRPDGSTWTETPRGSTYGPPAVEDEYGNYVCAVPVDLGADPRTAARSAYEADAARRAAAGYEEE